jgi:hypothetical protein
VNVEKILARCDREIARVRAGGGAVPNQRASFAQAEQIVGMTKRRLKAGGLGFVPLLPLIGWALAALIGTATIVGGIAIVRSTDEVTQTVATGFEGLRDVLRFAAIAASVAIGLYAAAKLAPTVAGGVRGSLA